MKLTYNFYIFGNPCGAFSAFPRDYTADLILPYCENITSWRGIIHKEAKLTYYFLVQNIGDNNYFGLGLVLNSLTTDSPKRLFKFLSNFIEKEIVEAGRFIEFDDNANMHYTVTSFSEKEYSEIQRIFATRLEQSSLVFDHITTKYVLPDRQEMNVGFSLSDAEIVKSSNRYKYLVVNNDSDDNSRLRPIIFLQQQVQAKNEEIISLNDEIAQLERTKKQYKNIIILFIFLLACCGAGAFLYKTLKATEATLSSTVATLTSTQDSLRIANDHVDRLLGELDQSRDSIIEQRNTILNLRHDLSTQVDLTRKAENKLDDLKWIVPLNVYDMSFYRSSGEVACHYHSFTSGYKTVVVRMFNAKKQFIAEKEKKIYLYEGKNSFSIYFDKDLCTSGYTRTFEVWCQGKIVGGRTFY